MQSRVGIISKSYDNSIYHQSGAEKTPKSSWETLCKKDPTIENVQKIFDALQKGLQLSSMPAST